MIFNCEWYRRCTLNNLTLISDSGKHEYHEPEFEKNKTVKGTKTDAVDEVASAVMIYLTLLLLMLMFPNTLTREHLNKAYYSEWWLR